MVYTLPVRAETLQFEDFPGLEVEVQNFPVDMDDYFAVLSILEEFRQRAESATGLRDTLQAIAAVLGKYLVSWNLAESADEAGLRKQPWELVIAIATGWQAGVAEVPVPLPRRSASGGPSQALPASPNHRSSQRRNSARRS